MHPAGLSTDPLLLLLSGDDGSRGALQATLSRLRRTIPVTYQPLRLDVQCEADFLRVQALLERGDLRKAAALYHGPLLETSEAPGVVEAREALEESLRQVALEAGDPDVLLSLAETLGGDLELWEAALAALPKEHPRAPLVRARGAAVRKSWTR